MSLRVKTRRDKGLLQQWRNGIPYIAMAVGKRYFEVNILSFKNTHTRIHKKEKK